MRLLRHVSGALGLAMIVSAVVVTTSFASVLPGTAGTTVTGKSGKTTFQVKGGASVTCAKTEISGEVLNTIEILLFTWHFGSCTTAGLPLNSLGDASGIILIHVELGLSFFPPCVRLKILPLHLEVPSTKLLLTLEGGAFGEIEAKSKKTTFPLTITQKEGKNTIETCEKTKETLTTSTDGGAFVQTGLEAKEASLTFGAEEEMM